MKNIKRTLKILFTLVLLLSVSFLNGKSEITTEAKKVFNSNKNVVTDRELAMLASLVYEDIPSDSNYSNSKHSDGCKVNSEGLVETDNCVFKTYTDSKVKRDKIYKVYQYVEGMSARKMAHAVSILSFSRKEDGEKYYFLNFASTNKEAQNWRIVAVNKVDSKYASKVDKVGISGQFYAMTFQKGNNYVIAYRGTDYPDLLEWVQDLAYALRRDHVQATNAADYARKEYKRITDSDKSANIYITGHSLGAYLAQIGGAAIVKGDSADNQYNYSNSSNLKKVVYFNGMGVSGIGLQSDATVSYKNALIALATHDANGNVATSNTKVNYDQNISSSGRLVLYSMQGDPVSGVGIHYGEIRKLEPAADAVTNHKGNHLFSSKTSSNLAKIVNRISSKNKEKTISELNKNINDAGVTDLRKSKEKATSIRKAAVTAMKKGAKKISAKAFNLLDKVLPNSVSNASASGVQSESYVKLDASNFFSGLSYMSKTYGVGNIIEVANISHETDSFLCLIDSENGVPTLTGGAANTDYDSGDNKTPAKIYANDKKMFSLVATVKGGCARSYTWYRTDKDGNVIEKFTTDKNSYNNYLAIPKNRRVENNTTEYYKVEVTYGTDYKEQFLRKNSEGDYGYELSSESKKLTGSGESASGTLTQMYEVHYDTEAPKCSFNPSSITIKKGTSANIEYVCKDNLNDISVNLGKIQTIDLVYFSHSVKGCANGTCYATITAKNRLFNVTRHLIYTTTVEDRAGNKNIVTSKLKIKTTR